MTNLDRLRHAQAATRELYFRWIIAWALIVAALAILEALR